MKKRIGLSLLALLCAVLLPIKANAATGEIFASTDISMNDTTLGDKSITIQDSGDNTQFYLGVNVTSGSITKYKARITLKNSNFRFKDKSFSNGWTGTIVASADGNTIDIDLTKSAGATSKERVATIKLDVTSTGNSATNTCEMILEKVEEETPETPKCQVVGNKYYDANGNEVSEEAYKAACTTTEENPQTGNFLPYTIIIGGIVIAIGLYLITKKNNKMYHV